MLLGVSTLATSLAYVRSPVAKALLAMFPIPFTLAMLAMGRNADLSNICAIPTLWLYYLSARWYHLRLQVPIVGAILLGMLTYALVAVSVVQLLPSDEKLFWPCLGMLWICGWLAHRFIPHIEETGHRSSLQVGVKFGVVSVVVGIIIVVKHALQGFASVFPMVGTIAVYESRNSLWTLARQASLLMFTMPPLLAIIRLGYEPFGLGLSLAIGWVAHLAATWYVQRTRMPRFFEKVETAP